MRYRKKPVVIEAVQYDGNFRCLDIFSINDVGKFIVGTDDAGNPCLKIPTLEGVMIASKGDYIIRGIKGEYYPCKPDIFEMTYERDEPMIIQAPIKNYDAWDEVIDQLGETNKMIDHVPDVGKMVEQIEKLAELNGSPDSSGFYDYKEGFVDGYLEGYNNPKETLFTEEQVREAIEMAREIKDSYFTEGYKRITKYTSFEIIQSLKQSKQ
jgi:hypothetical protein